MKLRLSNHVSLTNEERFPARGGPEIICTNTKQLLMNAVPARITGAQLRHISGETGDIHTERIEIPQAEFCARQHLHEATAEGSARGVMRPRLYMDVGGELSGKGELSQRVNGRRGRLERGRRDGQGIIKQV